MGLTWSQWLKFKQRGVAVSKVGQALHEAQAAGLLLTAEDLAAHDLAGGRVEICVAALIRARQLGVQTSWTALTTLDAAGMDPMQAIVKAAACPPEQITSITPGGAFPIAATCRNGQRLRAIATVRRKPEVQVFSDTTDAWREALARRCMAAIRRAQDLKELEALRPQHEQEILRELEDQASGLAELHVRYEPCTDQNETIGGAEGKPGGTAI